MMVLLKIISKYLPQSDTLNLLQEPVSNVPSKVKLLAFNLFPGNGSASSSRNNDDRSCLPSGNWKTLRLWKCRSSFHSQPWIMTAMQDLSKFSIFSCSGFRPYFLRIIVSIVPLATAAVLIYFSAETTCNSMTCLRCSMHKTKRRILVKKTYFYPKRI